MIRSRFARPSWMCALILVVSCSEARMPDHVHLPGPVTNQDPIVLVHGFAGWGPGEMFGYAYWGGTQSVAKDLNAHKFPTITASVGPISSNWDRACELYAQLRGVRVDYGAAHAARHAHDRYGKTYSRALFPKWGTVQDGARRRIHLIGHSEGGQTARLLAYLLVHGAPEEMKAGATPSPLFAGGKSWVHSVTTLSTPHNGTTLTYVMKNLFTFPQRLLMTVAALSGMTSLRRVLDFKLGHFGLARRRGESLADYQTRAFKSPFATSKDTALWDLRPEGAREFNARYPDPKSVYYFSWATVATKTNPNTGEAKPIASMFVLFQDQSAAMGRYLDPVPGQVRLDKRWFRNDGVVNTLSMLGPSLGSNITITPFSQRPKPGVWNYVGLLKDTDHMDVVGVGTPTDVRPWFRRWARVLHRLPRAK